MDNPKIGDVVYAEEVGLHKRYGRHKLIWHACEECSKERWVLLKKGEPQCVRCYPCGRIYVHRIRVAPKGERNGNWKGGRSITPNGYISVQLMPDSPFYPMVSKKGYVYEHRLVMAKSLGRCLSSDETVHHKNEDKHDNRLENLELLSRKEHTLRHRDKNYILQEIAKLEEENERLRGMLNEQKTCSS